LLENVKYLNTSKNQTMQKQVHLIWNFKN
jgi:hypothetical protein